jgi:hypothetical protein
MAPKRKLLFMTNPEHGAANVHLAAIYEILTQYPDVEVHFLSFPGLEKHVRAVSAQASETFSGAAKAPPIIFHTLPGRSITKTIEAQLNTEYHDVITHPPGVAGAIQSYKGIAAFAAAWTGEEHLKIYAAAASLIQDINPALVVLDPVLIPGIEACRNLKMKYVVLSPNAMSQAVLQQQPRGAMLWKYPA